MPAGGSSTAPREDHRLHTPLRGKRSPGRTQPGNARALQPAGEGVVPAGDTHVCRSLGTKGETLVIIEPIAADLDLDEVEVALLRAAVGD